MYLNQCERRVGAGGVVCFLALAFARVFRPPASSWVDDRVDRSIGLGVFGGRLGRDYFSCESERVMKRFGVWPGIRATDLRRAVVLS